jgi:hypothetical protein
MALTLEFGVAGRIAQGQRVSGDLELVHYYDGGSGALVAVIDGIDRGEPAARNARRVADALLEAPNPPVATLLARCHGALRRTPGVAIGAASIALQGQELHWFGVGNVRGVFWRDAASGKRSPQLLAMSPGLLGAGDLPALAASVMPLRAKDQLIIATDGIDGEFSRSTPHGNSAQAVANDIIARFAPRDDDALVVVVRAN